MPTQLQREETIVSRKNGAVQGNGAARAPEPAPPPAPKRWPIIAVVILVGILLAYFRLPRTAALPEGLIQVNGRIEGDLISISSKYSGRISILLAREGDSVVKGQLVVSLDDAETRARLDQAEANEKAAVSQAHGAAAGVTLTTDTTGAQVVQAQGVVNQAESGVDSARADLLRALAAVTTSSATARAADAGVSSALAGVEGAITNKTKARASLQAAEGQMQTARANTRAAGAAAEASKAAFDKASRDQVRYAALLKEGAVSEQTEDQAATAARTAKAQLDAAQEQISASKSVEAARQSEVEVAREQVASSESAIKQANAQLVAAREQAAASWSTVRQTEALLKAARQSVPQAEARRLQAIGQMKQARTAGSQVAVSEASRMQARARIEQAHASVEELKSTLKELKVVAPASGTVTTRFRDVGEVVSAGTPLLDIVDLDRLYLKVYVPETDIGRVRLGLPARIYVDAFPKQHFEATVTYIASTAEFTPKEVQTPDERVKLVYAVKLSVKSNPERRLTPGMPADAIVQWKPNAEWQRPRW